MYFVEIKGEKAFLTSEEVNGGSACIVKFLYVPLKSRSFFV